MVTLLLQNYSNPLWSHSCFSHHVQTPFWKPFCGKTQLLLVNPSILTVPSGHPLHLTNAIIKTRLPTPYAVQYTHNNKDGWHIIPSSSTYDCPTAYRNNSIAHSITYTIGSTKYTLGLVATRHTMSPSCRCRVPNAAHYQRWEWRTPDRRRKIT